MSWDSENVSGNSRPQVGLIICPNFLLCVLSSVYIAPVEHFLEVLEHDY